jgi:hypothetical protein
MSDPVKPANQKNEANLMSSLNPLNPLNSLNAMIAMHAENPVNPVDPVSVMHVVTAVTAKHAALADIKLKAAETSIASAPLNADSHDKKVAGFSGTNFVGGTGIWGACGEAGGSGVEGVHIGYGSGVGVLGSCPIPGPFGIGVKGEASPTVGFLPGGIGVQGIGSIGIHGKGEIAGKFEGDVEITGHLRGSPTTQITCRDVNLAGSDCAEKFDIAGATAVDPGTVMVIDHEGALRPCQDAYDRKVAGVISGAGNYKPGLILGQEETLNNRQPVALLGKAYCKADAQYGAIEVGDILTTSPTQGHAMKASDPSKTFGTTVGKALHPLKEGQGLIPILIALQ